MRFLLSSKARASKTAQREASSQVPHRWIILQLRRYGILVVLWPLVFLQRFRRSVPSFTAVSNSSPGLSLQQILAYVFYSLSVIKLDLSGLSYFYSAYPSPSPSLAQDIKRQHVWTLLNAQRSAEDVQSFKLPQAYKFRQGSQVSSRSQVGFLVMEEAAFPPCSRPRPCFVFRLPLKEAAFSGALKRPPRSVCRVK